MEEEVKDFTGTWCGAAIASPENLDSTPCGEPQFHSPGGPSCARGHGGADMLHQHPRDPGREAPVGPSRVGDLAVAQTQAVDGAIADLRRLERVDDRLEAQVEREAQAARDRELAAQEEAAEELADGLRPPPESVEEYLLDRDGPLRDAADVLGAGALDARTRRLLSKMGRHALRRVEDAVVESRAKNEPLVAGGPALGLVEVVLELARYGLETLEDDTESP